MAYDSTTGRLALIDDQRGGIAFYDVDQLLAGNVEPKHVLKTDGEASAVPAASEVATTASRRPSRRVPVGQSVVITVPSGRR